MSDLLKDLESLPPVWPFLWMAAVLLASMVIRKARGKPVFYEKPPVLRFRQWNASGRSRRNRFTRLGGANGCLVVQVTDRELDIHPFFPFNLFFLPEIYDLEHRVRLGDIVAAKEVRRFFLKGIEIEWTAGGGGTGAILLFMRRPEEFLAAIGFSGGSPDRPAVGGSSSVSEKAIHPGR